MDKRLCAAAVQFNIVLGDVDQNLVRAAAGLERAAKQGAQLAVLPEMWSAGYDYKRLSRHAEKTPGVLDAVSGWSAQFGLVVVGSLPEKMDDRIYNTAYVIDQGDDDSIAFKNPGGWVEIIPGFPEQPAWGWGAFRGNILTSGAKKI